MRWSLICMLLVAACGPPYAAGSRAECSSCEKDVDCEKGLECVEVSPTRSVTGKACFQPGSTVCKH